jgi:predicted exporter
MTTDDRPTRVAPRVGAAALAAGTAVGVYLAGLGSVGAAGAVDTESNLGHTANFVWWVAIAVAPWLAAAVLLGWIGGRRRQWRRAIRWTVPVAGAVAFLCLTAVVAYSFSGL